MNTKKMLPLFVLVPVVVVLGVALGVLNHADTEEEDTSIALCSLDADSVTAIAYKDASDGATLESALTKTDDTWTLDSDPALPLDQSKAQGVADSMTALTALRELSDDADVASMGFDTPTYELSLKTADTEWTLTVGSKNSITNNWYARLSADGPVYTLDSSALSGICKTAKQLYAAQSITDIDVDDVTKMVVQTANGGTLSFAQNDSTWTLTDDAEYNLNQDIVKKMASTICDLKTKWSVTEPQADAVYGLDTPNAIVTLIASDGTSIQCSFGGNDAEDAEDVQVHFGTQSTTAFAYSAESGTYGMLHADGTAQLDANTGTQAQFDNLLILFSSSTLRDDGRTLDYDLTLGGGVWLNGGRLWHITWTQGTDSTFLFYDSDGRQLSLCTGRSYLALVSSVTGEELAVQSSAGEELLEHTAA